MKIQNSVDKCTRCGSIKHLVIHHVPYIPEVTEIICRVCDAKDKRHPEGRGFPILKVHPQRGKILIRQDFLSHFPCGFLEIETAPISPIGVIFPLGADLEEVEQSLQIVLRDIRLRMGKTES